MVKFLVAANFLMFGILLWKFKVLPEQIPIFYSKPWGEAQIADVWYILILPIFMNLMFFVNNQITKRFFSNQIIFQNIFFVANIVLIIGFTVVYMKILLLIT